MRDSRVPVPSRFTPLALLLYADRGMKSISERKKSSERTSYEVRKRWDQENLKKYGVSFHRKNDADLIAYIEQKKGTGIGTSDIFRAAIERMKNEG